MAVDSTTLRALLRDPDQVVFQEDDLTAAIAASGDSLLRAAGIAFKSLAAEYSTLGKSVKTDDLAIDITDRGPDLLAVAESFMRDADAAAAAEQTSFTVIPLPSRSSSCVRPEGTPYPYPYRGVC